MSILRYILFPFGAIYFAVTWFRNYLFNKGIYKSTEFDLPIIAVGNLSAGGTGKTPHVEYLIRLLKEKVNISTLSRGYGRKTPGFQQANHKSTAQNIGDEPLQFYTKFKDNINVFVEANRVLGVVNLLHEEPDTSCIILDDGYQHRAIKPGYSILLTDYNKPFYKDIILPTGDLRESRAEKKRADTIIVTKCPANLTVKEQKEITEKINPLPNQKVYFSYIKYGKIKSFNTSFEPLSIEDLKHYNISLFTGIANDKPLLKNLDKSGLKYVHTQFPDHHNFTKKNISNIINIFDSFSNDKKIILTTEKDAVRVKHIPELKDLPVYYIEIEIDFITNKESFDSQILTYVEQNKRDS